MSTKKSSSLFVQKDPEIDIWNAAQEGDLERIERYLFFYLI